jgi:hypothetical protein
MPAAETQREADLFDVLSLIFLEPRQSVPVRQAVARAFGDANLEMLIAFLAFIRTAHYWTETHPELEYEPDMLLLIRPLHCRCSGCGATRGSSNASPAGVRAKATTRHETERHQSDRGRHGGPAAANTWRAGGNADHAVRGLMAGPY